MNAQQGLGIALAVVGYVVTGGNPLGASLGYAVGAAAAGAGTPLRIPFGNKEAAMGLGARYGKEGWYAPPGTDLGPFRARGWL